MERKRQREMKGRGEKRKRRKNGGEKRKTIFYASDFAFLMNPAYLNQALETLL